MGGANFRDLVAWQKGMALAESIYRDTALFPGAEVFGLTAQMRRAAVSIPSNIAEGQGRRTRGDFRRGVAVSLGSLGELETQTELARRFGYLPDSVAADLGRDFSELGRILNGLARSLERAQ